MRRFLIFVITLSLLFVNQSFAQKNDIWTGVEKFLNQSYAKSALKLIDSIHNKAIASNDCQNILLSYRYYVRAASMISDSAQAQVIKILTADYPKLKFPCKNIASGIWALAYYSYYVNNRSKLDANTFVAGSKETKLQLWSAKNFALKFYELWDSVFVDYLALDTVKISRFDRIIRSGNVPQQLRPHLLDVLGDWAIENFKTAKFSVYFSAKERFLSDELLFAPAEQFVNLKIEPAFSFDSRKNILRVYQFLLKANAQNKNLSAFIDQNILRIKYAYEQARSADKDSLYVKALKRIYSHYSQYPASSKALWLLAEFYQHKNPIQALYYLNEMIKNYPHYYLTANAVALRKLLLAKSLSVKVEDPYPSQTPIPLRVSYKNINKPIALKIIRLKQNIDQYHIDLQKIDFNSAIFQRTLFLPKTTDLKEHSVTTVISPNLTPGKYLLVLAMRKNIEFKHDTLVNNYLAYTIFRVTDIGLISQQIGSVLQLWVVDRLSGRPLSNAKVSVRFERPKKRVLTFVTDRSGYVSVPYAHSDYAEVEVRYKNDYYSRNFYLGTFVGKPALYQTFTDIFLNSKIFRPGQTVRFKVINFYRDSLNNFHPLVNKPVKVSIYSAQNLKVKQLQFRTDSFGACWGSYVLPSSAFSGMWRIAVNGQSQTFRVEQYKKPTFKIRAELVTTDLRPGDTAVVRGKAETYINTPVANAHVKYTVIAQKQIFFWWFGSSKKYSVASGTTTTDSSGNFKFSFPTVSGLSPAHYVVNVYVTDINGETQTNELDFVVSNQSYFINVRLPSYQFVTKPLKVSVNVVDVNGKKSLKKVRYKIFELKEPEGLPRIKPLWSADTCLLPEKLMDKLLPYYDFYSSADPQNWQVARVYASGWVQNGSDLNVLFKKAGAYKLEFSWFDPKKSKIIRKSWFVRVVDKNAPDRTSSLYVLDTAKVHILGQSIKLFIGSGWKKARVLVQATYNDHIVFQKFLPLSAEQKQIVIPTKLSYRNGLGINVLLMKYNRVWAKSLFITFKKPDKHLRLQVVHKPAYIEPGKKAQLVFRILGPQGKSADVQMLASAYDLSLDRFVPNNWTFSLLYPKNSFQRFDYQLVNARSSELELSPHYNFFSGMQSEVFPHVIRFFDYFYGLRIYKLRSVGKNLPQKIVAEAASEQPGTQQHRQVYVRKNFLFSPFFYPDLRSDRNGYVKFSFKNPDNITTWKLQVYVTDKEMNYALKSFVLRSFKPLIITPQLPRLVYQGDKVGFNVKVSNLTTRNLDIRYKFLIVDAVTEKILFADTCSFLIQAKTSVNKIANILVPSKQFNPLKILIYAQSDSVSDAVQQIIPVLNQKILLTQSKVLEINGKQKKSIDISQLVSKKQKIQPYKLLLEFAQNPTWYAITAMPYLTDYPYTSNEQVFSKLFVYSVAKYLMAKYPQIPVVLNEWKKLHSQSLRSNLAKDQNLKNILIEQTPWLIDQLQQNYDISRVADIFDPNNISYNISQTAKKLLQNQNSDHGWGWFPSMPSDWFTTQYIVLNLLKLKKINALYNTDLEKAVSSAMVFIRRKANDYLRELLKYYPADSLKFLVPSQISLQYLHTLALYDVRLLKSDKPAKIFLAQAKNNWTKLSLRQQAILAEVLYALSQPLSRKILKSLLERSLSSPQLGIYWNETQWPWQFYSNPLLTQTTIIQAFASIDPKNPAIDQMRLWLLKQKQTTHWSNTMATVQAILSLLSTGTNWLQSQPVKIYIDGKPLKIKSEQEPATGYFKTALPIKQLDSYKTITIDNPNAHPAWGAVYFQFFQNMQQVSAWSSKLSVHRQFYVKKATNQGYVLVPVSSSNPIYVGQSVVVKIDFYTDRDLDYVHLQVPRPAGFEPQNQLSSYVCKGELCYYQTITDAATNFFIRHLPRGWHTIEYTVIPTLSGRFNTSVVKLQCLYAPEFSANSNGQIIKVK